MKNLLLSLSLLLVATFSFGTKIPSPRGSGALTSSHNETNIEYPAKQEYTLLHCATTELTIENIHHKDPYTTRYQCNPTISHCKDLNIYTSSHGTFYLAKVEAYGIDASGSIDRSNNYATWTPSTTDSVIYNLVLTNNVRPDQYGRFIIALKFKSDNTQSNMTITDYFYLQIDCTKFRMAWRVENNIEVRDEVERFKIHSESGEEIVSETGERSVDIERWKDNKYVVVEVLFPAELAGKYMVELDGEKDDSFVYPNPTSDFIKLNEAVEYCILKDEKGEVKGEFKNVKEIDIREFGDGTYYLQIITDDKLIKTHRVLIKR